MKRKSIVLVLCLMLMMIFVGCGKGVAEEDSAPSASEVVSEVVSEEVLELASEEVVSEEVSEPVSEVPEIVDGVQMVYYENYEELIPFFDTVEQAVVVVFNFAYPEKGQALLYDGAYYTIEKDWVMTIKSNNTIENIVSSSDSVEILNYEYEGRNEWDITLYATGTDIEVPLTITYEDGTEETLTVYITKDWKWSWEE